MKVYEGKTIEEILETAANEEGVHQDDLGYFVKGEKKGILGIGNKVILEVYSYKDVQSFIYDYLNKFFTNLEMEVEIEVEYDGKGYKVLLNNDNNAIIIGKGGLTLQSLTIVLRGAANAMFKRRFLIVMDINNYKADKYEKLKSLAFREAKKVQTTKISAKLDPMQSDERRVIHNYLTKMPNIDTVSEGEGKDRRLVIYYKEKKGE